ncbi:hypothetical protein GUJ93_ZPchr0010g10660 [Zizania palustris]|uniref:Glycoside hydrolase family 19 catalytic domain-containing protein n=1 Tax=Zizania palustris TaxID=103762 RepID=A0A8J5WBX4_ZIZPA|nr:hypothetical protein GUJ93_ZPchr0010g10660 [Zizania palustris]
MRSMRAAMFIAAAVGTPLGGGASGGEEAQGRREGVIKRWECSGSWFCCNEEKIVYQVEDLFSKRKDPLAHATGFWYQDFITAAALFEHRGFGTTGGKDLGMREIAAFLGHELQLWYHR